MAGAALYGSRRVATQLHRDAIPRIRSLLPLHGYAYQSALKAHRGKGGLADGQGLVRNYSMRQDVLELAKCVWRRLKSFSKGEEKEMAQKLREEEEKKAAQKLREEEEEKTAQKLREEEEKKKMVQKLREEEEERTAQKLREEEEKKKMVQKLREEEEEKTAQKLREEEEKKKMVQKLREEEKVAQELRKYRVFAIFGDYFNRELSDFRHLTFHDEAGLKDNETTQALRELRSNARGLFGWKKQWTEVVGELESDKPLRDGRSPTAILREVCRLLACDYDQTLWVIRNYALRNRMFHNGLNGYIREGQWDLLVKRSVGHLEYMRLQGMPKEETERFEKCIGNFRQRYFVPEGGKWSPTEFARKAREYEEGKKH